MKRGSVISKAEEEPGKLKEPEPLDELRKMRQNLAEMKYNKYMEETKPVLEILDQGTPVKVVDDVDKTPVKVEAMKIPLVDNDKEEALAKKANYTPITSDAGFDMINIDL